MDFSEEISLNQKIITEARPFEAPVLNQIKQYYRIGLTWSSNAIEGNTLTESETKILLEDGLTAGGKPLRDAYEALGHSKAYDYMLRLIHETTVTEKDILLFHRLFYEGIDKANAGIYRKIPVFISGSSYALPLPGDIPSAMKDFCHWLEKEKNNFSPVEFSALAHQKFVFIHPFIDGNGRVGRLLMNTLLIQHGFLPVIIPPIRRNEYISLLEKAHTDPNPFVDFIMEMEVESQRDLIRLLHLK